MGIVRYPVECAGCAHRIVLRLGVGHEREQPFFFVCPQCEAPTKGALIWEGGSSTKLTLQAGRQLDSEDGCTDAFSINPEFPTVPHTKSMEERGGSGFIHFTMLMGVDRVVAYQQATQMARAILDKDWPALARLTTYYQNKDWARFDKGISSVWPDDAPRPTKEWHRADLLHRLYELLLLPICALDGSDIYPDMKFNWSLAWDSKSPNFAAAITFAKRECTTPHFLSVQRDLFAHIERYLAHLPALLPGLLCNMLPAEAQPEVDSLRLFRDDYAVLRDLYINTFETCHKALRWVIGASNATQNGDHNNFPSLAMPGAPKRPATLDAFSKLVNAKKRPWLAGLPDWDRHWDMIFDRNLRNDIGHASARHDLQSGRVERDSGHAIAYTRFVQQVQRCLHGLLACSNALKYIRIYSSA